MPRQLEQPIHPIRVNRRMETGIVFGRAMSILGRDRTVVRDLLRQTVDRIFTLERRKLDVSAD